MHRLSRQIVSTTRLLRPQKALDRYPFASLPLCRRCISQNKLSNLPDSLAQGPFGELYQNLRADLPRDELVKISAGLIKSAEDERQVERVVMFLEENYPHLDEEELHDEITRLLESKVSSESSGEVPESSEMGSKEAEAKVEPTSVSGRYQVSNHQDLTEVLDTQEAQEAIVMLNRPEKEKFQELTVAIMSKEEGVDVSSMRQLAELLGQYGLKMDVVDNTSSESVGDAEYQEQFMTEEQAELARRRAIAEANPLAQTEEEEERRPYPNLMSADPLMDSRDVLELPPTPENPFHNRVVVRNHTSMFHEAMALDGFDFEDPRWEPTRTDLSEEEITLNESAGVDASVSNENFFIFPLVQRWTTQQTGKGKIKHFQVFLVTGDGNGMVGLGIGMDEERETAFQKARIDALKKLDYVDRYENRTIWTDMKSKFRSTEIIMRPRPTGFGLRCGPIMHQVLKAAGIKDVSGKVWGSRNPVMIMQGLMKMLHGGHAPLGMGNGIGGKGKRLAKGSGMRTQFDVERDRGRKLVSIRK
ncbi:hypothetical protein E1B28_005603 [Marasmius oreades]|uniref:S5 DRBM domain-containing protein n=1 Tax=Marasmius oreades TaxID=181124 RepID=A0A9P7UUR5_9AGAR|nr:uncharacterized protein E1B28_005603 [Marasmius oreades]KAG7094788.1 hypothetical protein E1B28_005603 [Marasmius oreades]